MLGLIFLGVSHTSAGVNLLHPGAILIGLGGITFHLAQVLAGITIYSAPAVQCHQQSGLRSFVSVRRAVWRFLMN